MKKILTTIIIVIFAAAGLSLVLYPAISNYVNSQTHRRTIKDYEASVEQLDDSARQQIFEDAHKYNADLALREGSLISLPESEIERYNSLLDITGTGVMGYVVIDSLNISLPIYHGSGDAVLQSGIGHLEGSSLPVGGESTHAVLTGHRGLPSSKLFTNIDRLKEGDTFVISVLGERLTYEVDRIETVEPFELEMLSIVSGGDYCTLVTCTPYGVNTHRLLVRGRRIETPPEEKKQVSVFGAIASEEDYELLNAILISIAVILTVVIVLLAVLPHKRGKKSKEPGSEGEQDK